MNWKEAITQRHHPTMIPLVLLAGFLGAGKTRFLTGVIPLLQAQGLQVRVLLNDFENADIDAARLTELNALITPLAGECVCCASLRELLAALYAVPAEPNTVLLIEANGATAADELLAHLTMDARLTQFSLPLQLTVVDTARWQKRWLHNGLERSQVVTATHVQLNWTQRVKPERLRAVDASVRALNPSAAFTTASEFANEIKKLSNALHHQTDRNALLHSPVPSPDAHQIHGTHARARESTTHSHPFASVSLPLPATVERKSFMEFARTLPTSVVRAKGFVRFSDQPREVVVWNRVQRRKGVQLDKSWALANAKPVALFIGVNLPVATLKAQIESLGSAEGLDR